MNAHWWTGRAGDLGGFTLVELLVATALSGLLLAMAWPWCWQVGQEWRGDAAASDAASTIAAVRRVTLAELPTAVALVHTPDTACGRTSMAFVVPGPAPTMIIITYVWDARRRVLWRKASGSHLAEAVTQFDVEYFDGEGRLLGFDAAGIVPDAALDQVRLVCFTLRIDDGAPVSWDVAIGQQA